jgi:hypothetical protein
MSIPFTFLDATKATFFTIKNIGVFWRFILFHIMKQEKTPEKNTK